MSKSHFSYILFEYRRLSAGTKGIMTALKNVDSNDVNLP